MTTEPTATNSNTQTNAEQPQVVAPPLSPVQATNGSSADSQPTSSSPLPSTQTVQTPNHPDANTAKWVVVIVILLLLVIAMVGALVLYLTQLKQTPDQPILSPRADTPTVEFTPTPDPDADPLTEKLQTTSDSDRLDAIEQDLTDTELDNLTQELKEIEDLLP